jgi:hypothetical protein
MPLAKFRRPRYEIARGVPVARLSALSLLAFAVLCNERAIAGPIQELDANHTSWFYNRPGITVEHLNADLSSCHEFAREMLDDFTTTSSSVIGPGLAANIIDAGAIARQRPILIDDCMISLGYRRFDVQGEPFGHFEARYAAMDQESRAALAASETPPEGALARQWDNSVWMSAPGEEATVQRPTVLPVATGPTGNTYRQVIRAERDLQATLDANEAIIVLSVRRIVERGRVGHSDEIGRTDLIMGRADAEGVQSSAIVVAGTRSSRVPGSDQDQILETRDFLFVVPEGTYFLKGAWVGWPVQAVEFCLGTPAFSLGAGEVVHAGVFTLRPGGDRVSPSTVMAPPNLQLRLDAPDLDAARTRLSAAPEVAARLREANWQNGFVAGCPKSVGRPIYGFDIPGAAEYIHSAPRTGALHN